MNFILFGFPGSGKTHYGKLLAEKVKCPFIDIDHLLSDTPHNLFKRVGEEEFRKLEKQALFRLHPAQDSIIALGGGTVLDPQNVALLQTLGNLVYLHAGFETVKKRLLGSHLPAFLSEANPTESLDRLYRARLPVYEAIPARKVSVEERSEASVLAMLRALWDEDHT